MLRVYPIPCPRTPKFSPAPCEHKMEMRVKVTNNGQKKYREYCRYCGHHDGDYILKKDWTPSMIESAVPLEKNCYETWRKHREQARKSYEKRNNATWNKWYDKYRESPEWRHRREMVFERCGYMCECCGDADAVEVHHTSYALVGREPLFHLVGICGECHRYISANGNGHEWNR